MADDNSVEDIKSKNAITIEVFTGMPTEDISLLLNALKTKPNALKLLTLSINDYTADLDPLLEAIFELPELARLTLDAKFEDKSDRISFAKKMQKLFNIHGSDKTKGPKLTQLELSGNFTNNDIKELSETLPHNARLEILDLQGCDQLNNDIFQILAPRVALTPGLTQCLIAHLAYDKADPHYTTNKKNDQTIERYVEANRHRKAANFEYHYSLAAEHHPPVHQGDNATEANKFRLSVQKVQRHLDILKVVERRKNAPGITHDLETLQEQPGWGDVKPAQLQEHLFWLVLKARNEYMKKVAPHCNHQDISEIGGCGGGPISCGGSASKYGPGKAGRHIHGINNTRQLCLDVTAQHKVVPTGKEKESEEIERDGALAIYNILRNHLTRGNNHNSNHATAYKDRSFDTKLIETLMSNITLRELFMVHSAHQDRQPIYPTTCLALKNPEHREYFAKSLVSVLDARIENLEKKSSDKPTPM